MGSTKILRTMHRQGQLRDLKRTSRGDCRTERITSASVLNNILVFIFRDDIQTADRASIWVHNALHDDLEWLI